MRRRINVAQPGPQQRRRLRAGAIGYVQMPVQAVAKIVLGTVGNILGFSAEVMGVVHS